jgi:hypothetical protein
VDEVENFARRRPAMFLGGAFLLGLAATRFLKSSRQSHSSEFEHARYAGEPDPSRALPAAETPRMDVSGATTPDDEDWREPPQSAPAA